MMARTRVVSSRFDRLIKSHQTAQRNEAVEVSLLKGRALRVNGQHYAKLRALYTHHHLAAASSTAFSTAAQQRGGGGKNNTRNRVVAMSRAEEALFHERLGCLLFRYQALAAEDQAREEKGTVGAWERLERALPPRVFDVLDQEFGARLECFASPFNARYGHAWRVCLASRAG